MKKTVAYCRTALAFQSDPLAEVSAQAASLRQYRGSAACLWTVPIWTPG